MRKVELESHEWGQVMGIIGTAPWNVANGLLMKIGEQLRRQELPQASMSDADWKAMEHRLRNPAADVDGSAS